MICVKSLVFILLFCVCATQQDVIKLDLYYESLCPYSRAFIKNHLAPGAIKLGDALEVGLIPFGFANYSIIDGKYEFNCQHGAPECEGNKIQACVIGNDNYTNNQKLTFVNCMSKSTDPSSQEQAKKCATDGIDWVALETCINGIEGDKLVAYLGDVFHAVRPTINWVPWIVVDGEHWENDNLRTDMLGTLCKYYKIKPYACHM